VFIEQLTRPGDELPLVTPEPAQPDDWVKLANEQNNALIASRFAAESAAHALGSAWGSHFPTLDLIADRTKFESETTGTIDTGVIVPVNSLTDTEGDTLRLQLSVPIFAGGATQSGVRQARYRSQAADQRLERVTRETQRQARDALLGVTSEIARVKALKQSVASSTTALRATEAGFDVGTRTTVDVLNSRRTLLQAHVNYRKSKYDYLLNTLRLKQAAGMLVDADVTLVNGWMISSPSAPALPVSSEPKPKS
jgi:outer membrane protein